MSDKYNKFPHISDEEHYTQIMKEIDAGQAKIDSFKLPWSGKTPEELQPSIRQELSNLIGPIFTNYLIARGEGLNRRQALKALFTSRQKFLQQMYGPK